MPRPLRPRPDSLLPRPDDTLGSEKKLRRRADAFGLCRTQGGTREGQKQA